MVSKRNEGQRTEQTTTINKSNQQQINEEQQIKQQGVKCNEMGTTTERE